MPKPLKLLQKAKLKTKKIKPTLGRHLKWLPKKNWVLVFSSVILYTLAVPPYNMWIFSFIAFIPFFIIQEEVKSLKKLFLYGWVFGFILYAYNFYWLSGTISVFGGLNSYLAFFVFLLFALAFSLKYALFNWLANALQQYYSIIPILSYGSAMILVELFFPELFPNFVGNTQISNFYFIQIIDVIGIKGMSFIVISINYLIYATLLRKDKKMLLVLASIFFIVYSYGFIRLIQINKYKDNARSLNIGLIQPDTPFITGIGYKDFVRIKDNVIRLTDQLVANTKEELQIIVWPESATPFSITGNFFLADTVRNYMRSKSTAFIFNEINYDAFKSGAPLHSMATMLDNKGELVDHYNKIYLLPFGEYMPLSDLFPSLISFFPQVGNFKPGGEIKNFLYEGVRMTPQICYEIILPDFVRRFVRKGSDVIINLTNDKWFGKSRASEQHLWLLRPRVIENRIPLVRATNSGISAILDQTGEFVAGPTKIFVEDYLAAKVYLIDQIFGLYTYLGDSIIILIALYT
ncbi:MAG: apolipoprotein N-acyltransferase, partial [Spirochaetae bacterium HGW-Spirochaetae-6]